MKGIRAVSGTPDQEQIGTIRVVRIFSTHPGKCLATI
jgi:hypothetical protein